MAATVVLKSASRARWLKARRRGLGATDATAVLGFNPYKTPLDVWLDKRQPDEPTPPGWAAARGLHMEPFLRRSYAQKHPDAWLEKPPALLAHPDHPHVLASLDGLAHHPDRTVVLELKTANLRAARDWWDGVIPDAYACQVLLQLAVTGLDEAHVVADLAGDYLELTIMRDPEWEDRVLPELSAWWQRHVVGGEVPDIDPVRDYAALNRVWRPEPGVEKEADDAVMGAVRAWSKLNARHKERAGQMDRLRGQVRTYMREATVLTRDGQKVAAIDSRGALRVNHTQEENGE